MRRTLALSASLAILSAIGCVIGCTTELHHGLDERQANEVIAELGKSGIAADKSADDRPGTFKVSVPRGDEGRAVGVLAARDLPRGGGKGVGEAFAENSLLPSPIAERARLGASLGADLERTLEAIPNVTMARVHVALPDEDPLRPEPIATRVTASILLRTRAPLALPPDEIRKLVSSAVPGLEPSAVTLSYANEDARELASPSLVRVGPIVVAESSRAVAIALFSLLGFAVLALAAACFTLWRRGRF